MFKYILFDWDGCLAKTLDVWLNSYLLLYTSVGIQTSKQEIIEKSWGNLAQGPKNFGISNPDKFWKKIVNEVKKGVQKVKLYDEAKEILISLKKANKKIAIVTSSERKLIQPAIKYHNLESLIDILITEEDVSKPKPDPEIIDLTISKLKGNKKESVIIGDTGKDIISGKNAGIKTILIYHKSNKKFYDFTKLKNLNADFEINHLLEIENIV
jgi:pyrophosphatase PpaX